MKNIILLFAFLLFSNLTFAQTFTNYTTADGLGNNVVNCLVVANSDVLWFGTNDGVSRFDGSTWTNMKMTTHPDLVDNVITAIAVDSDGNIWVGSDFGAGKYDGSNWTSYTTTDGLADDRIKYIKQDLDGKIWFGNNDGVSVLDGSNWTSYTTADGLPFGGVNFVTIHPNGDKWFGTGLGGVYIFDGTTFTAITEGEGLLNDKVRSIAISPAAAQKWVGTSDGISVFDANNFLQAHHTNLFPLPAPDTLNPVVDVQMDSYGRLWAGIYVDYLVTEGGVSMYDGTSWISYDVDDGLIGPVVRRLAIDSDDNVWVATSEGITKISDSPVSVYAVDEVPAFSVYPNPVTDLLQIELDESLRDESRLEVYNATLQKVALVQIPFGQERMEVSMSALASGMYFVRIGNQVAKVIKN